MQKMPRNGVEIRPRASVTFMPEVQRAPLPAFCRRPWVISAPICVLPPTSTGSTRREGALICLQGIGGETTLRDISSSADDTVPSSDIGANSMPVERFEGCPPRFEVCAMLATDHPVEASAAFFKESINLPIIIERYLWVELLW